MNMRRTDAKQWQDWILNYLPQLKTFRFHFHFRHQQTVNNIQSTFQEFQNDFWQKQHQWHTEYIVLRNSGAIYSVPYYLNSFTLDNVHSRYDHPLLDNSNKYDTVTHLEIGKCDGKQMIFRNVDSLDFTAHSSFNLHQLMEYVDLIHIKKLIFQVNDETKFWFLSDLLRQTPNISSLSIHTDMLYQLFRHSESYPYLLNRIEKLNLISDHFALERVMREMHKLSKSPTVDKHSTYLKMSENLLIFLMESLPKVTRIEIAVNDLAPNFDSLGFIKQVAQKLNLVVDVENNYGEERERSLVVWITR